MHMVKCSVCGERFDRDRVQAVKTGARRYAHQRCCPEGELVPLAGVEADEDLVKLEEYIKQLLHEDFVNARVKKQIKDFKEEYGYSYSGMLKSLIYFYEVKGNPKEKANGGIGIIPYIYKDAYNYYLDLFIANNKNKDVTVELIYKTREVKIKEPKPRQFLKKLFDLGGEDE